MRMSIISESYKEQLTACLDSITERTQDFTDSAYTSHEHRQNIILLCDALDNSAMGYWDSNFNLPFFFGIVQCATCIVDCQ